MDLRRHSRALLLRRGFVPTPRGRRAFRRVVTAAWGNRPTLGRLCLSNPAPRSARIWSPPRSAKAVWARCIARATKLDRDVALKVLPEAFTAVPDRLARFEREAKVLASLNHPNIGGMHGLEDSADVRALVLELVEGTTLADRVACGSVPLADTGHDLDSPRRSRLAAEHERTDRGFRARPHAVTDWPQCRRKRSRLCRSCSSSNTRLASASSDRRLW